MWPIYLCFLPFPTGSTVKLPAGQHATHIKNALYSGQVY